MNDPEFTEATIDLRTYLKVLSRRRWLMLATFLTVVLSTAIVSWQMTPTYEAEAQVEVLPTSSSSEASRVLESLVDPTRALQTQVGLIESKSVLDLAAAELGLPSSEELEESLSVSLQTDTQIIEIVIEHPRPDEASSWANAVAESYIGFRRDRALENSISAAEAIGGRLIEVRAQLTELDQRMQNDPAGAATLRSERDAAGARLTALEAQLQNLPDAEIVNRGGGTIISAAGVPTAPVRPNKLLNLALAVIVGSMLALGLVLLAENLDDRMRTPEEVEERVGAPILGYVPLVQEWSERDRSGVAVLGETASGAAEAFRTLSTNLRYVSLGNPIKTLLVTSAVANSGKSTAAANLAAALAQGDDKVVLISADLRRPSIHKLFGLTNSIGLLQALDPDFPLNKAVQNCKGLPNLKLLAAGGLPPNPTEILASTRFAQLMTRLASVASIVVIDAPPVLGLGDSSALASRVDGVLFVVRTGEVTKREISDAVDQVGKAGGKIVGTLLNAVEAEQGYGYYYHYYYSQYQQANGSDLADPAARSLFANEEGSGDTDEPDPPPRNRTESHETSA